MSSNMIPVGVDGELYARMCKAAEASGRPVTAYLNKILDDVLPPDEPEPPKPFEPVSPSGRRIVGTSDVLYGVARVSFDNYPMGYEGYTQIDWDSQEVRKSPEGEPIWVDDAGDEWSQSEITWGDHDPNAFCGIKPKDVDPAAVDKVAYLDLNEVIECDLEGFLDLISEAVGHPVLSEVSYELVGLTDYKQLVIRVTGKDLSPE